MQKQLLFALLAVVAGACGARTPTDLPTTDDAGNIAHDSGVVHDAQAILDAKEASATCSGSPQDCPWGNCLDGPLAECVNGQWTCPPPPDPCGGVSVPCGPTVCSPNEYCRVTAGGPPPLDGGYDVAHSCVPVPSACTSYGAPSCGCVEQYAGCGPDGVVVQCNDPNGGVTLECDYP